MRQWLGGRPEGCASGQLAAGLAAPPANFALERAGFRPLINLFDVPYQNIGIVIRRSRADELGDQMVPFLRAPQAGVDRYYQDKKFAITVISRYSKEKDPEILDRTYEFYRQAGFRRDLALSEKGVRGILEFLQETIPAARQATPSQFFDDRFVRQVGREMGPAKGR